MSKNDTPHIVLSGNSFLCRNCYETHAVTFPLPITAFTQQSNAFIELHRDCTPTQTKDTTL